MALTETTFLGCLYLVKIKENHGFITQTEWVCLHSGGPHRGAATYQHRTYLICLFRSNKRHEHANHPSQHDGYVLNIKRYLLEYKFFYSLLLVVIRGLLVLMICMLINSFALIMKIFFQIKGKNCAFSQPRLLSIDVFSMQRNSRSRLPCACSHVLPELLLVLLFKNYLAMAPSCGKSQ